MLAEGKLGGEGQTCFTCSDLNRIKYFGQSRCENY